MAKINPRELAKRKRRLEAEKAQSGEVPKPRKLDLEALLKVEEPRGNHAAAILPKLTQPAAEIGEPNAEEQFARSYITGVVFDNTLLNPLYTTAALANPDLLAKHPERYDILVQGLENEEQVITAPLWREVGYMTLLELLESFKDDVKRIGSLEKQRDNFQQNPQKGAALKAQDKQSKDEDIQRIRGGLVEKSLTFMEEHNLIAPDVDPIELKDNARVYVTGTIEMMVKALYLDPKSPQEGEQICNALKRALQEKSTEADEKLIAPLQIMQKTSEDTQGSLWLEIERMSMELGQTSAGGVSQMIQAYKKGLEALSSSENLAKWGGFEGALKAQEINKKAYDLLKYAREKLEKEADNIVNMLRAQDKLIPPSDEIISTAKKAADEIISGEHSRDSKFTYVRNILEAAHKKWDADPRSQRIGWDEGGDWRGKARYIVEAIKIIYDQAEMHLGSAKAALKKLEEEKAAGTASNETIIEAYNTSFEAMSHLRSVGKLLTETLGSAANDPEIATDKHKGQIHAQVKALHDKFAGYYKVFRDFTAAVVNDKGEKIDPFERSKHQIKKLQQASDIVMKTLEARHGGRDSAATSLG
jgi:ElaB/YqjD/DUF883 family membrane-anchored ribosome-binding protein